MLIDGGFRRGVDVVKALALGARAVLIGRPHLWGVACAGEDGVHWVSSSTGARSTEPWRSEAGTASRSSIGASSLFLNGEPPDVSSSSSHCICQSRRAELLPIRKRSFSWRAR